MNAWSKQELMPLPAPKENTCDNALAETVNGLYKSELIYSQHWAGLTEVEWATLCWVNWWNNTRLHSELGYATPQETEDCYYQHHTHQMSTA
ncbi:integrase core domain-containing protein [Buchananella felis]|uniref:integrase core domain-containing protein n=1 Tax=Buchananella felis TaxID=3231492 RepID=UPI0035299D4C